MNGKKTRYSIFPKSQSRDIVHGSARVASTAVVHLIDFVINLLSPHQVLAIHNASNAQASFNMPGVTVKKLGQKVDIDYTLRKVFGKPSFR